MRLVCLFVYTPSSGLIYMHAHRYRPLSYRARNRRGVRARISLSFVSAEKTHGILRVLAWLFLAK